GNNDDDVINVELPAVPPNVNNLFFPVSLHDADARLQSFGQVTHAYIRVLDPSNSSDLPHYDFAENAATETAMLFGELYR
ncbi:TerD family protein, partial [Rhodococcus erythropolis]|uniref:TerD family protein n=1 Tax=Rhodococcus erythropolis TaxID=1833 RepID=UPI003D0FB7CB